MAKWWTKVNGNVQEHANQRGALLTLFVWRTEGLPMALYRRNPEKHADAEDLLPAYIEKTRKREMGKQIRAMMKRKPRAT